MKLNTKSLRRNRNTNKAYLLTVILAFAVILIPTQTFGQLNLWDIAPGLPDIDNRAGSVLPTAAQLSQVQNLGARADWNKFGTINTMVKDGGYISTDLMGEPVAAAREWIRQNRELFKLSEQGVADLTLVNDAKMPYNDAHFILFRQQFGGRTPTLDGQINVSIINGNVFHVWSSSAGDQPLTGQALITPVQAWLAAAKNVNLGVPASSVLSSAVDANNNWTVIKVDGFKQDQLARLTAVPTPGGNARLAYEVNVTNVDGATTEAYTDFIDAQTGSVLTRNYKVNWLNDSAQNFSAKNASAVISPAMMVPPPPPPMTTTFQGEYQPRVYPCGGTVHNFTVPAGKTRIAVQATAAVAANDIKVHLLYNGAEVASADTGTSSEALTYIPAGGVPAGTYTVAICQTTDTMGVPQSPPYSYVGTFTTDDTVTPNTPNAGIPSPRWKYHTAFPDLDFLNTDTRRTIGCWEVTPGGIPPVGCMRDERNIAARAPWDWDFNAGTFTGTTRGNAAQTAESWGSPLTPSTPYAPESAMRDYTPKWTNHWNRSKCDPTILKHTGGAMDDADIDATIVQMFVTHNRFHDWSYYLGYTEQNYNNQLSNFGNTDPSRENDPEIGNAQAGAVSGGYPSYLGRDNANQVPEQDGVPGITNQYLFQPIGAVFYAPCTDGAQDVGIVGHEYTHEISNRMIAGPDTGITTAQGQGMGESWSDLDAGEFENAFNYVPQQGENPTAIGIYATNNRKLAIRDYSLDTNSLNYSNFGFDTPGPEFHADGEIWNGVNWQIRQALNDKYNAQFPYSDVAARRLCAEGKKNPTDCAGNRRWIQIMFDSFLLMPGAPSMLTARDAELAADVARFGGANQVEMWRTFARFGMGQLANSNGGADVGPIPDFSSPLESNATVTFKVVAQDENNTPITTAKIFVGDYEARCRPIADTDPATVVSTTDVRTNINDDKAQFVPGTYNFIVQAPGYGYQKFTYTLTAGSSPTITFSMPTNRASVTKGASVTTTATVADDQTAKNNLIDDTEGTGARLGTTTTPADDSMTVKLQGTTPLLVTNINVSTAAGPNNPGRFTGIRKFAILACTVAGTNLCTTDTNFTQIYTSPDDAFPGGVPRPVQPQLTMRNFDIPDTMATHLRLKVLTTQCTGKAEFLGEQDNDPLNNTDCATFTPPPSTSTTSPGTIPIPPGMVSRATEFQAFTSAPTATQAVAGIECDVFSRPDGNGLVTSGDVTQIRRFAVGLDSMTGTEFQRADCSNISTLGDGIVNSVDVAQARRYQVGLDALRQVGGPTAPVQSAKSEIANSGTVEEQTFAQSRRDVRVTAVKAAPGQTTEVAVEADTSGKESIYGFTMGYDSAALTYVPGSVKIGSGASRQNGGNCDVLENANVRGQIGFLIDCNSSAIKAGNNRQLVTMQFVVASNAPTGKTSFSFNDTLSKRSVASNPAAGPIQSVPTSFTGGSLNISTNVQVAGRILSADGSGLNGVIVYLVDANGVRLQARTNLFGYYHIDEVSTGKTYNVTASHKRYQFTPQVVVANEAVRNLDFTAQP